MKKPPEKLHVKVADLMQSRVMSTTPSQTVGRVRAVMTEKRVHCMPVLDPEGRPLGIVTSTDLLAPGSDARPVSQVMTEKVHSVPLYAEIALAAQTMRKHHVHHVVVVDEKKVVGIISSFDVLRIVEDRTFSAKKSPTRPKHRRLSGGRRETEIHGHAE
jgi:CBS domain-containing protein